MTEVILVAEPRRSAPKWVIRDPRWTGEDEREQSQRSQTHRSSIGDRLIRRKVVRLARDFLYEQSLLKYGVFVLDV